MNKRGQLTSTQLVVLIFSITGFLIVGFATFKILGKETTDVFSRETCHLSVLTRATVPDVTQSKVPLKCSADKFCFTTLSNGKCSQFAGETGVQAVLLPKDASRAARLIERVSANALYDCWTMMGEGKLDIFGSYLRSIGFDDTKPTCVVCSRLAVADDIRNDKTFYDSLKQTINVNSFLENTPATSGGPTYLELLSQKGIKGFRPVSEYNFSFKETKDYQPSIDGDQIAFIFSQVKAQKVSDVLTTFGLSVAGGTFVIPGGASSALALGSKFPLASVAIGAIVAGAATVNTLVGQQAAAGYCGSLTMSTQGNSLGCSLVKAVNYNLQDLNAFCPGNIQGNP